MKFIKMTVLFRPLYLKEIIIYDIVYVAGGKVRVARVYCDFLVYNFGRRKIQGLDL